MRTFDFSFCGLQLCCGGHTALTDMFWELGIDVEDEEVRLNLNKFFAERFGLGRVMVEECPGPISKKRARYSHFFILRREYRLSKKRARCCYFFILRTEMNMVSPLAIIAVASVYAGAYAGAKAMMLRTLQS